MNSNSIVRFTGFLILAASILQGCSTSKNLLSKQSKYTQLDTIEVVGSKQDLIYRASATRDFDLIHTKLILSFDWKEQHVLGEAYLTLRPYFYEESNLVLDAKGFDIHKLGKLVDGKVRILEFEYDSSEILIDLGQTYSKDESLEIYIAYTAKPNLLVKESPSLKDNKGLYFIDPLNEDDRKPEQIWTQGETESSSCWFPTIDNPNERCTQEIYVTVQDKYITFSNGLLKSQTKNNDGSRTDYWKQDLPHAPYLFALVVGEYAIIDDSWRDIEVDYFVEPEFGEYAQQIFGNTPEMLDFYSKYFGVDYPWEKYHQIVVRDFVAGAMENTSATIHFEGLHMTDRELLDGDHEDIIAHEVTHQWFGDLVTCESWSNIPLNEAFATYGEYLWIEHKYGQDQADMHLYRDMLNYFGEARIKQLPLIRYNYDHPDDMFDRHSYEKGGRVLHMLRNYVGEEAFKASLQRYLIDNSYKSAEIANLRMAFEEITGEDLNWFFNQWFMKPGHPKLTIDYALSDSISTVTITQKPSTEDAVRLFKLPLAIDIYTEKGKERHEVTISEEVTEIELHTKSKPLWVNVDGDKMLLCQKNDNKELDQWVYQYENGPLMKDRYEAVAYLEDFQDEDKAYDVMRKAMTDPYHNIRRKAIKSIDIREDDLSEISQSLRGITKNDKESNVRSEALSKLAEVESEPLIETVLEALNDQSYMVISSALDVLIDIDSNEAIKQAKMYEEVESFDLQNAVARIYSKLGDASDYPYFVKSIQNSGGYLKYSYAYHFGNFLGRMQLQEIQNGVPILKELAMTSDSRWVKTAGREAIERIQQAYKSKKKNSEDELKQADSRDLGKITTLENNVKEANAILDYVDNALGEIKVMN